MQVGVLWERFGSAAAHFVVVVAVFMAVVGLPTARGAEGESRVEVVGLRSQFSRTFRNPEGTFTTVVSQAPVNFRDAFGRWRPIRNRLVAAKRAGYELENEDNEFAVSFRRRALADGMRVDFEDGSGFVLGLAREGARDLARSGASSLTYADVVDGVDLRYRVIGSGVKEDLILRDASAPSEYEFVLRPHGLSSLRARRDGAGGWVFVSEGSPEPRFLLAAPTVADSARPEGGEVAGSGDPSGADALFSARGKARLDVTRRRNGDFLLRLGVDEAWLRDPARVFPVVVDPTITLQPPLDAYWESSCGGCGALAAEDKLLVGSDGGGPTVEDQTRVYVGSVVGFAGAATPAGWLEANGVAVSRSTYSTLFSEIGTVYGGGDGSATFNLPDLQGRGIVGVNPASAAMDSLGESEGAGAGSRTPAHSHSFLFTLNRSWVAGTDPGSGFPGEQSVTTSTSSGGYLALRYLIKADPAAVLPVGAVLAYAGGSVPSGWLAADGAAVSRTGYADLFSALGTIYGGGDGSSTFNPPDLRGRTIVGKGVHGSVDALGDNEQVAVGARGPRHSHTASVAATRTCYCNTDPGSEHVGEASATSTTAAGSWLTQRMLVKAQSSAVVPPGSLIPFAGSSTPAGYLLADGAAVSRTGLADLYAATGTTYGNGDGSSTFNLPDPRGRLPVGLGPQGDVDSLGESDGLGPASRTQSHGHSVTFNANRTSYRNSDPGGAFSGTQTFTTSNATTPSLALRYLVRSRNTVAYTSGGSVQEFAAATQFDLGALPTGAAVTEAKLKLYWRDCLEGTCPTSQSGPGFQVGAYRLTSPWGTTTTSAGLANEASALSTVSFNVYSGGDQPPGWRSWQGAAVTSLVADWIAGAKPNYGFLLARSGGENRGLVLASTRASDPALAPQLEITWSGDAVQLLQPQTLHSDGAELAWERYAGSSFQRYEVHRSETPGFQATASTLVATIGDPAITRYRDTTAAPAKSFSYRILTNGSPSNAVEVALPADGTGVTTLQPAATGGSATYVLGGNSCANMGSATTVAVDGGANPARALLSFDLRNIPSKAQVTSASLSLFTPQGTNYGLALHRVAADWREGTGTSCNNSGATWAERQPAVSWGSAGVDFDPAAAATTTSTGGANHWDAWDVRSLVQQWLDGSYANFGVLLKHTNEGIGAGSGQSWYSDDYTVSPTLRPKLAIAFADGSHALAPFAAVGAPAAGAKLSGETTVVAAADDDGRVAKVELLLDGQVLATLTSPPWQAAWNTLGASRGEHTLAVRATDDAGNLTTSAPVTVTVANSNPPTLAAPSVTGTGPTYSVTATASDDVAVERVEFYVDGDRFGTDTSAPYEASLETLSSTRPVYDGSHSLTAKAYDADGQSTGSSSTELVVANGAGTIYKAEYAASAVPLELAYDPALPSQETTPVDVALTNTSSQTWTGAVKLRYRWLPLDSSLAGVDGPQVSLGSDLAAGGSRTVRLDLEPPPLGDGSERAGYRLRLDLYDTGTESWFAAKGAKPWEQPVTVTRRHDGAGLGLERHWYYDGIDAGAGIGALVNLANGNLSWSWTPLAQPGRGLSTVLTLSYNSLERRAPSPAGNNVSLGLSGLARLGQPLDIHPNAADTLAGRTAQWIGFADVDGTPLRFTAATAGDGSTYWQAPAGVHLYLRRYSTTDASKAWALTRPDRTTFFFDSDGYPTGVEDGNGNRLQFTLEPVAAGEDAAGLAKRVTQVVDAAGQGASPAPNRTVTISYYTKAETGLPSLRGKVKQVTDHVGHAFLFDYYEDGNLLRVTARGGRNADGSQLADRSLIFTYTTPTGSEPALATAEARANPDPGTPQSARLYSLRDFRGAETRFSYLSAVGANQWKLASVTDRAGATTSYSYDPAARTAAVTRPLGRNSSFSFDTAGRATAIENALAQTTTITWTADNAPERITQPTGRYREFAYNANGYLTSSWDELRNQTTLEYENLPADPNDVSGKWKPGRTIPHLSQLSKKTDPVGNATTTKAGDYVWQFAYSPSGNLLTVTDPLAKQTTYTYNPDGTVATVRDALNRTTAYEAYDANGLATQIRDAAGGVWKLGYADNGNLQWLQDANHASASGGDPRSYRTTYDYDSFGRLGRSSKPKSTQLSPGLLIWSGSRYDSNDNPTGSVAAHYGAGDTGSGPLSQTAYDPMDRPTLTTGPDASSGGPEQTEIVYDEAGRAIKQTKPRGVRTTSLSKDFATFTGYDLLDRVASVTQHEVDANDVPTQTRTASYCYDLAGDLRSVTGPKGAAGFSGCPAPLAPDAYAYTTAGYTSKLVYDAAHRLIRQTNPLGHSTETGYDANGAVISSTDAAGATTTTSYDDRGARSKLEVPFDTTVTPARTLTTLYEYDPVGNLSRLISPRAYDASPDKITFTNFVESYTYDALNRLTRTELPSSPENTYSAAVLADSPGGYWRLGETAGATLANELGSSPPPSPDYARGRNGATGDGDTAINFSGGWGSVPSYSSINPYRKATIEFWYKGGVPAQANWVLAKGSNSNGEPYVTYGVGANGSNRVKVALYTQCCLASNTWDSGIAWPTESGWHHFAVSYDADAQQIKLYIDGTLRTTGSANWGSMGDSSAPLQLMRSEWLGGAQQGELDEVAVYTSALSGARIQAHYDAASSGYSAAVLADSPGGYWRLGGSSGTTLANEVAGAPAGSLTGPAGAPAAPQPGTLNDARSLGQPGATADGDTAISFTGGYASVPSYGGAGAGINPYRKATIEFWYKGGVPAQANWLLAKESGANAEPYLQYGVGANGSNQVKVALYTQGTLAANTWNTGYPWPTASGWHHFAVTYDADAQQIKLYVDGAERAAAAWNKGSMGVMSGPLFISRSRWLGGANIGQLDEVAVYASALSAARIQAHYAAAPAARQRSYQHRSYDGVGNLLSTSLPTVQSEVANVAATEKTTLSYWDTGSIASSIDPGMPLVRFDYSAEGWQALRVPETAAGSGLLDYGRAMRWAYDPDGLLREIADLGGQHSSFAYDADGNQVSAVEGGVSGTGVLPLKVEAAYDGFDQLQRVAQPKLGSTERWVSSFAYDQHANLVSLVQNARESAAGAVLAAGRAQAFGYDEADRLLSQTDDFGTPADGSDDDRYRSGYTATGLPTSLVVERASGGGWASVRSETRAYHANGLLKTLTTLGPVGALVQSHQLEYVANGVYLNGNRTRDVFRLLGPDTGSPCRASACTAVWGYDARERLTREDTGTGTVREFTLDPVGNVTQERLNGSLVRSALYTGQQLREDTVSGVVSKYLYDSGGNLDCQTTGAWAGSVCPAAGNGALLLDYAHDYRNRLSGSRAFAGGVETDSAGYAYDGLDRPVREEETHAGVASSVEFVYLGLGQALGKEILSGATTREYVYNPAGLRLSLTETTGSGTSRDGYVYDPHGNVSLLHDRQGTIRASYGYEAYGNPIAVLTKTAAGFNAANNPYRYSAKRYDSGSGTLDMGARRYSAKFGRFLQHDSYSSATANLGLSQSSLTAGRYNLAGGNPISYIETDGHLSSFVHLVDGIGPSYYAPPSPPVTTVEPCANGACGGGGGRVDGGGGGGADGGGEAGGGGAGGGGIGPNVNVPPPRAPLPGPDPNSGNQCTDVPDAIHFRTIFLIDFSPACRLHDQCYGRWLTERLGCDNNFHDDTRKLCSDKFSDRSLPWIGNIDKRLTACYGFADLYHYGVQQLGNVSWFDKAYRYKPHSTHPDGGMGCPYLAATFRVTEAHARCKAEVRSRTYGNIEVNAHSITKELLRQLSRILPDLRP